MQLPFALSYTAPIAALAAGSPVPVAPALVGQGEGVSSTGTIAPHFPAAVNPGELALLLATSANQTIAVPSGWAQDGHMPVGAGSPGAYPSAILQAVMRHICSGSEDGATVSMADSGTFNTAVILTFSDVNPEAPVAAAAGTTQSGSAAVAMPPVDTPAANCLILFVISSPEAFTTSTLSNSELTNVTSHFDLGGTSFWTAIAPNAGNIGQTTINTSGSHLYSAYTLALSSAPQ